MSTTPDDKAVDLPTMFDPETCTRKGLFPVSSLRNKDDPLESHSLYWEQHGSGPEKIFFVMGMNSSSFAWRWQVEHFGRDPRYSVVVFDNRGVGHSGTPRGPYTTAGMAEDAIALLNYIGWTEERSIHVVGTSLGGMISQHLALRIPERMISLTLAVTTAGGHWWGNFPPWAGIVGLTRATFTADPVKKIPIVLDLVFPPDWLAANRDWVLEDYHARVRITPPQRPMGAFSQMFAGLTHHVRPEQLRAIARSVPKVLILTGDEDNLVRPKCSLYLKSQMPEAELVQWEHTGHGIHVQWRERFNELAERVFEEGRQQLAKGFNPE
ncbi:alpha/beta hydrolase [Phanerochaete sordida]|uniref:Alpha/beta hydrolase n=1 Tax=Phanerochaete sordida TaxID=48140 RepID=A0A9P3GLH2_9APHY|nr:alpha/beta hydrolase [Phanerochaete sordida]